MTEKPDNINSKSPPSTFDKAVKSGGWVAFSQILQRAFTFIRLAVLARLLSRADFGMIAIAQLIIDGINHFTATGFKSSLIQKKKDIKPYLDTAWSIELIRGIILFLFLFIIAPFVVRLFDGKIVFTVRDISKPVRFAQDLTDTSNPVSKYLMQSFPEELRNSLSNQASSGQISNDSIEQLIAELNNVIKNDQFYLENCLRKINLSAYTRSQINQIDTINVTRLNKRILEDVYPKTLNPSIIDIPQGILMVRIVGISMLIGAVMNIGTMYFIKDLKFHKKILIDQIGTVIDVAVAIGVALIYRNVWALVCGKLSASFVRCTLSYVMHPYRPRFSIDLSKAAEMWNYGKHLLRTNSMKYLIMEGDDIYLGWMLGVTTLGMYRLAYQLSNMVATEIGNVINQVTFPAYASVQDHPQKLINGFMKTTQCISLVCIPITGILFVFAPEIVQFALGSKWLPIVPTVRILSFVGVSKTIPPGGIYNAIGRPDIPSKLTFIRLLIIAVSIYPLTKYYGMPGTAMSIMLPVFIMKPVHIYLTHKFVKYPFTRFYLITWIPVAATILACGISWTMLNFIDSGNTIRLLLALSLCTVTYAASILAFNKIFKDYRIMPLVQEIFSSLKT